MEQTDNIIAVLDLMPCPGFCVKAGIIFHVNQAAGALPIFVSSPVTGILATGKQEYIDFQDGTLNLTLLLNRKVYDASVTRLDGIDLFILEQPPEQSELQALALAAQHLRTPLSNIMTLVNRILPSTENGSDAPVNVQKFKLNHSLFQMLRIICNMSDAFLYSQTTVSRMEIRDISAILNELFEKNKTLIAHAGITLHFSGLSESVFGLIDTEKLERAIENILANAMKYTPRGGSIEAKLTRKDSMLYLTIQDNGDGIPQAAKQNLYTRYLRQPCLGDSRDGIGLGMVLIRSIAALHGGTVLIQPAKDRGTRFTMTIAIRQTGESTVHTPALYVDYTGERDHTLVELSESLPPSLYE